MDALLTGWLRRGAAVVYVVAAFAGVAGGSADAAVGEMSADERAKFERDRQAILGMAGEYRVSFKFMETVPIKTGYEPKAPYFAAATEFVDVIEDAGDRVVLQHVLVLTDEEAAKDADAGNGVRVVKHWRQDWTYEDTQVYEFKGRNTWAPRNIRASEAEGTWSQAVFQVDDSPRYESVGKWVHTGEASTWQGGETWRPLPRREHTKRKDYQVMGCVNRHTVTPTGWFHEEDNYKLVLPAEDKPGKPVAEPVLVREAGLNEYRKVSDLDFSEGRAYWQKTQAYWRDVRSAWDEVFAAGKPVKLRRVVEDRPMFRHLFEPAEAVEKAGTYDAAAGAQEIRATLAKFLVEGEGAKAAAY